MMPNNLFDLIFFFFFTFQLGITVCNVGYEFMLKCEGLMKSLVSEALMYISTKRTVEAGGIPKLVRFQHTPWGAFLNFYR